MRRAKDGYAVKGPALECAGQCFQAMVSTVAGEYFGIAGRDELHAVAGAAQGRDPRAEVVEHEVAFRRLDQENGMRLAAAGLGHADTQGAGRNAGPNERGTLGQGEVFAVAAGRIELPEIAAAALGDRPDGAIDLRVDLLELGQQFIGQGHVAGIVHPALLGIVAAELGHARVSQRVSRLGAFKADHSQSCDEQRLAEFGSHLSHP